jgi:hypothetical protein
MTCDYCGKNNVKIFQRTIMIPIYIFESIEETAKFCKTCNSIIDFIEIIYLEAFEHLDRKITNRCKQMNLKLKRNLR